jgi:hypothetical protein
MSASQQGAEAVTAMQIVDALRAYERHMARLASGPLDMDVYQAASLEIDQIRAWCGTLPQTSVPWIGLLISHADFVYLLWREGEDARTVQERLRDHRVAIRALVVRCEKLAARGRPDPGLLPAWA